MTEQTLGSTTITQVAIIVKDIEAKPLVQRGEYTGGRYAYFDGNTQLGAIVELLEND